ncbi:MAG: hypothetical protein ABIS50_00110 [Luteolibacter sp.]|uniref:hypothetical protein n=1 Tax=Luteolibacter sp. TaxID=1962973 RepID=UPI003264B254
MKEENWTKFLRGLMILFGKKHLIIKREWQVYYYVDRKFAFLIFPKLKSKYIIQNEMPIIRSIDMLVDFPEGSEINTRVGGLFLEYAAKNNFKL